VVVTKGMRMNQSMMERFGRDRMVTGSIYRLLEILETCPRMTQVGYGCVPWRDGRRKDNNFYFVILGLVPRIPGNRSVPVVARRSFNVYMKEW